MQLVHKSCLQLRAANSTTTTFIIFQLSNANTKYSLTLTNGILDYKQNARVYKGVDLAYFNYYCFKYSWVVLSSALTLWEPGYDIFVLWNRPKTSSCQLPYQRHSSSANCAKELFKWSNGLARLLVCTQKKFLVGGCGFFVSDIISEAVLGRFGSCYLA